MVAVTSTMQALGTSAPGFTLPDVTADSAECDLASYAGKPLLVMFICNHCPYVVHLVAELAELANQVQKEGVAVLAISSNDAVNYPQDGPEAMVRFANQHAFEFPYLYDETQQVAKDYSAACTPDFFVYDAQHCLRYRGQMDDARPGNGKETTGSELLSALAAVMEGRPVNEGQVPSIGCNIKWRAGNEPDYV